MDSKPELSQKIIRYVIKNTPFGETKEVVKDLCKIISSLNPQDKVILSALKEHNEEHLGVFKKDGEQVISSVLNAQDDVYVDQSRSLSIVVDHSNLTIVSSQVVDLPKNAQLDALRNAIEVQLKAYLVSYFKEQLSGFYVIYTGDQNNYTFYIGVTAKNINLPNFYTGDWFSKWEATSSDIKGELSIQAHYYEEGNVQLKNNNKFNESWNLILSNVDESAKTIVDSIARLENRHQNSMEEIYGNMPEMFFKAMRRILPITGTKMDWNIHAHKVAQGLKQNH